MQFRNLPPDWTLVGRIPSADVAAVAAGAQSNVQRPMWWLIRRERQQRETVLGWLQRRQDQEEERP